MNRFRVPVLLCVALSAVGCASTLSETDKAMQAWVGDSVSNLVASWGPPQTTYDDGKGGRILIYGRGGALEFREPSYTNTTQVAPGYPAAGTESYTTGGTGRQLGYVEHLVFWADKDGTIYKWRRSGLRSSE
jgi:hypothetical protein